MISSDAVRIRAHVRIVAFQLDCRDTPGSNATCNVNFNLYSVCGRIANNNEEGALNECRIIFKKWQCHAIILASNNNKSETDCECGRWEANNECVPAIEYHVNDTPYARSACEWQTLEFRSRSNAPTLSNAWCHKVVLWVNACIVQLIALLVMEDNLHFALWNLSPRNWWTRARREWTTYISRSDNLWHLPGTNWIIS